MGLAKRLHARRDENAEPEVSVRRLGPADEGMLAQLAKDNARFGAPGERLELAPLPAPEAHAFLSDDRTCCLVAFADDEPVGFLYACELYRRHSVLRHLCLYEVGVADDRRGLGIGAQLIEALGVHARSRGIERGFVLTNDSNRPALELYKSVGAKRGADDDVVLVLEF